MVELRWSHGRAVLSPVAGMVVEAVFLVDGHEVRPLASAPWRPEDVDPGTPGHLRVLGGDFLALPFGSAAVPPDAVGGWAAHADAPLPRPPHGWAAEEDWTIDGVTPDSVTLRLDFPPDSPIERVERTVAGTPGRPELRIQHVVHARRDARVPLGLHPVFALPTTPRALQLDASFGNAYAYPAVIEPTHSRVPAGAETHDLAAWDADRLPDERPREDVILLADVTGPIRILDHSTGFGAELDWDHDVLPNAMLWISDRGIAAPPWSGRYRGLGIEPLASAFDFPAEVSLRDTPLGERGVRTAVRLDPAHPLTVRHSVRAFRLEDEQETIRP